MSSTFGGSRSSAELPVVIAHCQGFLLVGAPGYDPGRLQQSAAPAYKTELHASADAVLVGVAGFEPATSSFRTKSASRLRYTPELARCTGVEPVSLDRQSSCLTRCITAQRDRRAIRCARAIAAVDEIWCAWLDSNEHWTRSQRVPSAIGVQAHGGPGRIRICEGHSRRIKIPPVRPLR